MTSSDDLERYNSQFNMLSLRLLTPEQEREVYVRFADVFMNTSSLSEAAKIMGLPRGCHNRWMAKYPEYRELYEEARASIADTLEAEAIRRARDGYERPIFQQGVEVGRETVYSDSLLTTLLKAFKPEKYREKVSIVNESMIDAQIKELEEKLRAKGIDPDKVIDANATEVPVNRHPEDSAADDSAA